MIKCSVVMAVFNGDRFLREAVESVLSQSFHDFELIIVDDGSYDQTGEILASFQDPRMRVIKNSVNKGLAASLNIGVEHARGELIVRMDADDVMEKNKLQICVDFMNIHTNIDILGTWAREIDESGVKKGLIKTPIGRHLQFSKWIPSPLIHPSVVMRKKVFSQVRYDERLKTAQDYDLWLQLISFKKEFYNIPRPLLRYRVHGTSITGAKMKEQSQTAYQCFRERTGINFISFTEFLGFSFQNYETSVFRLGYLGWRIQKELHLSFVGFLFHWFKFFFLKKILRKKNQVENI